MSYNIVINKSNGRDKMIYIYLIVAGILGFAFMGPVGVFIGGAVGLLFGAIQSNRKKIDELEKEIINIKNNQS
jgi:hypothetical protein